MKQSIIAAVVVLALSVAIILQDSHESRHDQFQEWKKSFQVSWSKEQEVYRRIIFENRLKEIELHNSNSSRTYDKGINQFSAMTDAEFKSQVLMQIPMPSREVALIPEDKSNYPIITIDWVQKGVISPVKDQGLCGACWAFTTTALAQTWYLMLNQSRVDLSEQQLVDCIVEDFGCGGGWIINAANYVNYMGLVTEKEYPYVAKTQDCKIQEGPFKIRKMQQGDGRCGSLSALIEYLPIGVYVNSDNWISYKSGVFSNCGWKYDHAVMIVGSSPDYWKIKNSWGTRWGEQGYIRLAQGDTCGICQLTAHYLIPRID